MFPLNFKGSQGGPLTSRNRVYFKEFLGIFCCRFCFFFVCCGGLDVFFAIFWHLQGSGVHRLKEGVSLETKIRVCFFFTFFLRKLRRA